MSLLRPGVIKHHKPSPLSRFLQTLVLRTIMFKSSKHGHNFSFCNVFFLVGRVATKFDKVVRREVCSIQTKGTKRYSFLDGDASDTANAYLLAFCEKVMLVVIYVFLFYTCCNCIPQDEI